MYITLTEAAKLTNQYRSYIYRLAFTNKIPARRRSQFLHSKKTMWVVDRDQLIAYLEAHARYVHTPAPGRPPPETLSTTQHSLLTVEDWHTLTDLQSTDQPGTIRATWSDGESFNVHSNGDTSHYRYMQGALSSKT